MSKFGKPPAGHENIEVKVGKVTGVKNSPEKGRRRFMVSEKSLSRKKICVDIPYKEAKKVERKKTYSFDVSEARREDEYGGMQSRFTAGKMKTYLCDKTPEIYRGGSKPQFKSFGGDDDGTSSRLKF